jgi:hypothetical protein
MRAFLSFALGLVSFFCSSTLQAQEVAIKSNLLMDATLSPNLGVEVKVSPQWTLDFTGQVNAWTLSHQRRWKHWLVQPEARYWTCKPFVGSFWALHLVGGQYNLGKPGSSLSFLGTDFSNLRETRYQGWMAGAGIGYGYAWILSRHWNLEAELGLGWVFSRYDRYKCAGCGRKIGEGETHHYVGPTKVALDLVYVF